MAFLDETGLAELWALIQAEDNEVSTTLTALANSKGMISMWSYTGTGTFGADNPCSLTFDFVPKLIIMLGGGATDFRPRSEYYDAVVNMDVVTTTYTKGHGFCDNSDNEGYSCYGKKSADGKTFYWYSEDDKYAQCNTGTKRGIAFG